MRETRAESWIHLQELLFDELWNPGIGRFRSGQGRMSCQGNMAGVYRIRFDASLDPFRRRPAAGCRRA